MCGIFGIVSGPGRSATQVGRYASSLFKLSESRGKEASGLALLADGELQICKQPTPATKFIKTKRYHDIFKTLEEKRRAQNGAASSPVVLIGHSRLVTNGLREYHYNNQPVVASGVVAIHNGIVVNDRELWGGISAVKRAYEVDTEVITALVREFLTEGRTLTSAVQEAFRRIEGATSVALLFEDLHAVVLATNNGSIYFTDQVPGHEIIFASEEQILKEFLQQHEIQSTEITHLRPGRGCLVELGAVVKLTSFSLADDGRVVPDDLDLKRATPVKVIDISLPSQHSAHSSQLVKTSTTLTPLSKEFEKSWQRIDSIRRCKRCVLPETMPFSNFDSEGVCYFCRSYQPIKLRGATKLMEIAAPMRRGTDRADCVVSVSGGRDSSYCLHYVTKELGLKPVTYTYDWGMVTDLARRNVARMCGKLAVEHILVSADIVRKRNNIRKNVSAWLEQPDLGLVPLFMAGDKQFFYHGSRLMKQFEVELMFLSENPLEKTNFKTGFCGIAPSDKSRSVYALSVSKKLHLACYYLSRFVKNPRLLNSSLLDTFLAYCSYYVIPHNFLSLFEYIPWDENQIVSTLAREYDWEFASDTTTSWRIGDGTASFYNYIYLMAAGFTENDTFRSNQIREGQLTRDVALELVRKENQPRWDTFAWYCDTIGIDAAAAIKRINAIPRSY